jgi:pSer/pThr/pTyr-binding forkhead associated (FHA) protein
MSFTGFYLLAQDGKRVDLKENQLFGRETSCDVVLALGQASRRHAEIVIRDGQVSIKDLGSTNGSFVNEQQLDANTAVVLKAGDNIRMDANSFTLEQQSDANATMMRPMPVTDVNATVMRSVPVIAAAAPSVTTSVSRPEAPQIVAVQTKPATPESWAMQGQQAVAGTQLLSGTQMQGIRAALTAEALAAQQVDVPTLTLLSGAGQGQQFTLGTGAATSISKWEVGRAASCDVVIDDPSVSSNHAQIINEGARWKLIDLMSANGTYVNGEKGLTTYLGSGDQIRFGTVDAVFQLGGIASTGAAQSKVSDKASRPALSTTAIAAIAFAVTLAVIVVALVFLK